MVATWIIEKKPILAGKEESTGQMSQSKLVPCFCTNSLSVPQVIELT